MNRFQQEERAHAPDLPPGPGAGTGAGRDGCARCAPREVRARWTRSWPRWSRRRAARDNLMPPILDAAGAYATVGEISDRLRTVFGEYREV